MGIVARGTVSGIFPAFVTKMSTAPNVFFVDVKAELTAFRSEMSAIRAGAETPEY